MGRIKGEIAPNIFKQIDVRLTYYFQNCIMIDELSLFAKVEKRLNYYIWFGEACNA